MTTLAPLPTPTRTRTPPRVAAPPPAGHGAVWFLACLVCGLDRGSVPQPSPAAAVSAADGWTCPTCGGNEPWPVAGGR